MFEYPSEGIRVCKTDHTQNNTLKERIACEKISKIHQLSWYMRIIDQRHDVVGLWLMTTMWAKRREKYEDFVKKKIYIYKRIHNVCNTRIRRNTDSRKISGATSIYTITPNRIHFGLVEEWSIISDRHNFKASVNCLVCVDNNIETICYHIVS